MALRQVSAAGDSDGVGEADGSPMLPEVLRPAPGKGNRARDQGGEGGYLIDGGLYWLTFSRFHA